MRTIAKVQTCTDTTIDEKNKTLELWVRRKRGNRKLECSGCGRKFEEAYDANERAVRDLPWSSLTTRCTSRRIG